MTARSSTPSLGRLLELLELEQPRVVSRDGLEHVAQEAGVHWPINVVLQRLRERGWLLDLKTRGVWEFAPAARAGAYSAGDPLIELRATLTRRPDAPFAVAAESAAYLLGYASRRPAREAVSAPAGLTVPPALRAYRVVRWVPRAPLVKRESLPVWSPTTLVAFMAARPSLYRDWPNAGEWLGPAAEAVEGDLLHAELEGRSRAAWARAAYLLDLGGQVAAAARLLEDAPPDAGPYYLGPRNRQGRHSGAFDVIDSTGLEIGAQ
ncbi:MAG: type IV toxin-antitoxin system AbiEi family antitoxin [Actinomycetes bacterium]